MLRLLAVMLGQNLDVHNLNIGFASLSSPPPLTATPPIASIKVIWTCRGRNIYKENVLCFTGSEIVFALLIRIILNDTSIPY